MKFEYPVCECCFDEYGGVNECLENWKNVKLTHNKSECVLCKGGSKEINHFLCEECATIKEWIDFHYPNDDNEDEVDWFRCKNCIIINNQ